MARLSILLTILSAACILAADLPRIRVTLAVQFSPGHNNVSALDVTLHIDDAQSRAERPLLQHLLNQGLTPTLRYDDDALTASDTLGSLALSYTDTNASDALRTWVPQRDPEGQIAVKFRAVPRMTDATTPSGPRVDLRPDQGGAIGMGTGFIPQPPADEDWAMEVHWELPPAAPAGTRVASSLGDGLRASAVGRPSVVLAKSYFAVGQLQRWPSWDVEAAPGERPFCVYWIGALPYDSDRLSAVAKNMHMAISSFFGDTTSPFRVFWRHVWVGYGGAGGYNSFLLEWADGTAEEQSEEALTFLLSHETIHEYALMQPRRNYDMWYREGVAQYYAVVAPFVGGAVDKNYLLRWLNNNLQAYYTGGTANMTWQSIVDLYWGGGGGLQVIKAPYSTGFAYLAQVQGLIRSATNGTKSLDDLVLELYRRYTAHEQVQTPEFLSVLSDLIGNETAEESLSGMLNGSLIVPPADCFAEFGLKLVRRDAERFDLGFVPSQGKVSAFTSDRTRAQDAGLRVGDDIVRMWGPWGAGDSLDNMMRVVVRRNGREVTVEYWPRSYDKVENWEWVDVSAAND